MKGSRMKQMFRFKYLVKFTEMKTKRGIDFVDEWEDDKLVTFDILNL